MKKLLTKLAGLALLLAAPFFAGQAVAQGTHNSSAEQLIIQLNVAGATVAVFDAGSCGYGTTAEAAPWGGTVGDDFCAPIEWAYDAVDSLGCGAIPAGSLTGKVALIRRGLCNFSLKALNAQNAGAIAVIIANNTADTDCAPIGMAGGDFGAMVTIPTYSLSSFAAAQVNAALNSGNPVEVCFIRPDVAIGDTYIPVADKRTPRSQFAAADTFVFAMFLSNNRTTDLFDVELKATVLDENENELYSTSLVLPEFVAGITDSIFEIPGDYAAALPIGTYTITYSAIPSNFTYFRPKSSNFYITDNLFSKDDGPNNGYRPGTISGDSWGVATMYTMLADNLEDYMVNTIEFAFAPNTGTLAEDVSAEVYFFKVNDDVDFFTAGSFDNSALLSSSFEWLGIASYEAPTGIAAYDPQQVELINVNTGEFGIPLDKGSRYIPAVIYSGNSINTFQAFDEDAGILAPSTLVFNGSWFTGGFGLGINAVVRMYLDLLITTDEKALPETAMQIRPNPIFETLNLQMGFDQATDATITIAEMSGRVITFENRKGLTNDLVSYQVPQLATGTYLVRIATKAGTLTKKFVVQK